MSSDDMDAFLYEVDEVSKQIKGIVNGTVDLDKLDKKQKAREEREKRYEDQKQLREEIKAREEQQRLSKGRPGKGEGTEYLHICPKCWVEYQISTFKCYHCNSATVTKEERHRELKAKVAALKESKARKQKRLDKFTNWMKTEHILKKGKGFTNYNKWELYESEDETEAEPILPKNDPNFIALEKQMDEDVKKRKKALEEAVKLKEKGNTYQKEGKYHKAIRLYSEAMEKSRGHMPLYTNRATAYFKVEKYDLSIKDCDRVIDYFEAFEEEKQTNLKMLVKALLRKAQCLSKLKQFDEAEEQIELALEEHSGKEIEAVKAEIEKEKQFHSEAVKLKTDCEGDETFKFMSEFVQNLRKGAVSKGDTEKIVIFLKISDENVILFRELGGFKAAVEQIQANELVVDIFESVAENDKFVDLLMEQGIFRSFADFVWEKEFSDRVVDKISSVLESGSSNLKVRMMFAEYLKIGRLIEKVVESFNIAEIEYNETKIRIVRQFYRFISNICFSSNRVKEKCFEQKEEILDQIEKFYEKFSVEDKGKCGLMGSAIGLITNISCYKPFLAYLTGEEKIRDIVAELYLKSGLNMKLVELNEKCTNLLFNLNYTKEKSKYLREKGILSTAIEQIEYLLRNKQDNEECFMRGLMLVNNLVADLQGEALQAALPPSKVTAYCCMVDPKYDNKHQTLDQIVRLVAKYMLTDSAALQSQTGFSATMTRLLRSSSQVVLAVDKNCFSDSLVKVNNCLTLINSALGLCPEGAEETRVLIDLLIEVISNRTDKLRETAARLLARMAKIPSLYPEIKAKHGIDVIMNVYKFIKSS